MTLQSRNSGGAAGVSSRHPKHTFVPRAQPPPFSSRVSRSAPDSMSSAMTSPRRGPKSQVGVAQKGSPHNGENARQKWGTNSTGMKTTRTVREPQACPLESPAQGADSFPKQKPAANGLGTELSPGFQKRRGDDPSASFGCPTA